MKKIKKLSAVALIFAMILTSFSLISAVAAPLNIADVTTSSDFVDFENCTVLDGAGTALVADENGVITMNDGNFTIGKRLAISVSGDGNKAEIVTDTVSGSKALKLTYTGAGSIGVFDFYADNHADIKNVVVRTGAKVRIESFASNASMSRFGAIRSTLGYGGMTTAIPISYFFASFRAANVNDNTSSTILHVNDARNNYSAFSVVYNQVTDTAYLKSESAVENHSYSKTMASSVVPGYSHYVIGAATSDAGQNGPDKDTTTTVMYLDDMYVETLKYDVETVSIGGTFYNNATLTNVPLNAPIDVKFNAPVADASAVTDNFSLKDSSGANVDFSVRKESEDVLSIYPLKQKTGETYTLTVKSGVALSADTAVQMISDKSYTYTTCSDGLTFIKYIENENFNDIAETTLTFTDTNTNANTTPVKSFLKDDMNGQIGVFRYNQGDSVSVATDSVTSSKALKISRPQANNALNNTRITYVLPETYNTGKIVTSADLRVVRNGNTDQFSSFMTYANSANSGSYNSAWINKQDSSAGYYWSFVGGSDNWMNMASHITDTTVFPMTQYLDFTTKAIGGQTFRNYGTATQGLQTKTKANAIADTDDVYGMNIVNINGTKGTAPTGGTDIYLDNLKVAYYDYVKGSESAYNMQAIRFSTAGDNVNRALAHSSTGLQLVLEGTQDGETWNVIDPSSVKHVVEYRSLFNIAKVSATGYVTRVFAEDGNGLAPILAAYKNADGSIVTTKTNVVLHPGDGQSVLLGETGTGTLGNKANFENFKADDEYSLNGFSVVDTYKYYESVKDDAYLKDRPVEVYSQNEAKIATSSVLQYWFYDTGASSFEVTLQDGIAASDRNFSFAISNSKTHYCVEDPKNEIEKYQTKLERTKGWHQVTLALWGGSTNGTDARQHVVGYIDGECVYDVAVSKVTHTCIWQRVGWISDEAAKAYVSEVRTYKTRRDGLSKPVILDVELLNFVKYNDDAGAYYGTRYQSDIHGDVDYNPENYSGNNVWFDVFYNYYFPGSSQSRARVRLYANDGANGITGDTNGNAFGGKGNSFLTKKGDDNSYKSDRNPMIHITTAGVNNTSDYHQYFTFNYKTQSISNGAHSEFLASEPLLYGQDTTTGYYHDIRDEGVIGYSKVKAGVRYLNHYSTASNVYVAIAQYEDGRLVDAYCTPVMQFASATVDNITHEFTVGDSSKTEFKTFIWSSDNLKPKSDSNNKLANAYHFGPFGKIEE